LTIAPRHSAYDWPGGREWMLEHGPSNGPQVILIEPLFEERNAMRAIIVDVAHALAGLGIASRIADLPGAGDSLIPTADATLADWRAAIAAAAPPHCHVASFRGGALIDDAVAAASWWRHAPCDGASILRHLVRTQRIGDQEAGVSGDYAANGAITLAGYTLSAAMRTALEQAEIATPGPLHISQASRQLPWRRSEPIHDIALSQQLANDIAAWVRRCAAR
jgi:hypothetical protein